MKLRYLLAVSLLALASAGAQAATTLTLGSNTYSPGSPINITHTNDFTDDWTLNVDAGKGANGAIFEMQVGSTVDISSLNVTSMSPNLTISGGGNTWFFQAPIGTGSATYQFSVAGDIANGATSGIYVIGFSETAAPVPIPPAALLFGSALIGLAGLRRKKAAHEA